MQRKEIFSKLRIKNYNNELEGILEKKDFSSDAKSLLLSMLYKIEVSYDDYEKVKQEVPLKEEYIEELLEIIKNKCDKLEINKTNSFIKNKISKITKKEKKIEIYQSEEELLNSLYKLSNSDFCLMEKYTFEKKAIPFVLKNADIINKVELIRNFDGWSWNMLPEKILNIELKLLYQNLLLLIGQDFFSKWKKNCENQDYMLKLKNILIEKYTEKLGNLLYKLFCQCSIALYRNEDKTEKDRLEQCLELLKIEYDIMNNKEKYLKDLQNKKLILTNTIKEIDKKLNIKQLLLLEFEKRNLKLKQKVFSLSDLVELMQGEREKLILEIENYNEMMQPKEYLLTKSKIDNKIDFIEEIVDLDKLIIEFEKIFIKAIFEQIKKVELKTKIIELIYIVRYYKLLKITETKRVIEVQELKGDLRKMEKELITKACNLKVLNIISKNTEKNYKIISDILLTQTIDLEEIDIELENNRINIYEENSIKKIINVNVEKDNLNLKLKRKTKLFV